MQCAAQRATRSEGDAIGACFQMSASLIGPVRQAQSIFAFGFVEQNVSVQFTASLRSRTDPKVGAAHISQTERRATFWTRFVAQQTFAASSGPSPTP